MKPLNIDFDNIPDETWWAMCDFRIGGPRPIEEADLNRQYGWVYYRKYGIFYADIGQHAIISSNILSWELGFQSFKHIDDADLEALGICPFSVDFVACQDYLIENFEGVAIKSSVGSGNIMVNNEEKLTVKEYINFKPYGIIDLSNIK